MSVMENLWIEKYRPKKLDDIILPSLEKSKLQEYLSKESIPHLGFYGPPGTGKSTISRVIVSTLAKSSSDYLKINAALSGRIDTIRNQVIPFIKTPPESSKQKIVYFEEFDNTSLDAQLALKEVIESGIRYASFIITFNYENRVIKEIKSRIQLFRIDAPPLQECIDRCHYILDQEKINYKEEDVIKIVTKLYPQLRDVIKTLQMLSVNGQLIYDDKATTSEFEEVYQQIKLVLTTNNSYKDVRKIVGGITRLLGKTHIDLVGIMKRIANDDDIVLEVRLKAAGFVDKINLSIEPKFSFMNAFWELIQLKYALIQQGLM